DPTVRGGAVNPITLRKSHRLADIAAGNRLPTINLVESGGADLPSQAEIFIPGGRVFRDLTRASAANRPTIAVVFGNATAGRAYLPLHVLREDAGEPTPAGPAAGEDGHRRGDRRRVAGRRADARERLGPGRLPRHRRA